MPANHLKADIPLGEIEISIGQMLRKRRDEFGPNIVLQEKHNGRLQRYRWHEFYHEIAMIGASFVRLGVRKDDKVAILSRNRKEMLVAELASMSIGALSVPIFSEYPAFQIEYILKNSDAKILITSDSAHLREALKGDASGLEMIFVMDWDADCERAGGNTLAFDTLYDFKSDTAVFEDRVATVTGEDPCLLMYTSGTTGMPKGVVLCHRNILSQQKALSLLWDIGPGDRFLCYLPWHHSFGGIFEIFRPLYAGATLTIDESYGKDIELLIENFKAVKPTVYFSVPLIYQRIVEEARQSKELEQEIIHPEIKFVFTAAAPLPEDIAAYFKSKNIPVVEGWGLTETSPCVTVTPLSGERRPQTVGFPLPGVEVKLSPEAEILVKGPNVMLGYYKDPEKTAATIDADGWLRTGDAGEISEHGVVIKGRLDGVFKLSNAEKVSSQALETTLVNASEYINAAVAFGDAEDFVSVLIFPHYKQLETWAAANGIDADSREELLRHSRVRGLFARVVAGVNQAITQKYARIRAFALIEKELSLERAELTPSFKVVRSRVLENFSAITQAAYDPQAAKVYRNKIIFLKKATPVGGDSP